MLSDNLEKTIKRAISYAIDRQQEYVTLEHLLLALIDDKDALGVLNACDINIKNLKISLLKYIDQELKNNEPYNEDLCGTCTACIDECPTDAIVEPYILDSNKCISYLTIEHRDKIEEEISDKLDNWIYGCDICQEVCPWNIKFSMITPQKDFHPRKEIQKRKKIKDWNINKTEFNKIFNKSAVKRTKYKGLMRNISLVE